MNEVKTESHYGAPILLDQCLQCGGVWFDKEELLATKHGEAEKIDLVLDASILTQPKVFEKDSLSCPVDNTILTIFKDPFFPKELIVERCKRCGGFWFNRGEFKSYQNYRLQKQTEAANNKYDKLKEEINKLLVAQSNSQKYQTMAHLGEFLTSPVDASSMQVLHGPYKSQANRGINIFLSVVQIILRLFLQKSIR